jgi:hypothetical protein
MNFLNENHIQGGVVSKYRYGLYYNNKLVSLMTFGALRKNLGYKNKNDHYELLRFANKLNTVVVGGASKLFKHFIKSHQPKYILSYADRSWTSTIKKTLYDTLGFEFKGVTQKNYYYYIDNRRVNRYIYRKSELIKMGHPRDKSEREIMESLGYYRVYDSGNLKYEWRNNNE